MSLLILRAIYHATITARMWLIFTCITLWGVRLAVHIAVRHNGEDWRYKKMRDDWMQQGITTYYVKSFFFVFIFQGFLSLLINFASLRVFILSN